MKLLILGLDGLSFNLIRQFDPDMRYLDSMISNGVSGDLMSVDPPTTYPAWTSFATGQNPGTHGITWMQEQRSDYSTSSIHSDTEHPAIYDFFDGVWVNLQAAHHRLPAGEGYLIGGKLAPTKEAAVPEELQSLPEFDDYRLFMSEEFTGAKADNDPDQYTTELNDILESKYQFARAAFEEVDPDVGFVLFSAIDYLGHFLSHAPSDSVAGEWFNEMLERVDEFCAELAADAENVVAVSDHGFERVSHMVHINEWLAENGYLVEVGGGSYQPATDVAYEVIKRSRHLRQIASRVYTLVERRTNADIVDSVPAIDIAYDQSIAWGNGKGCIYINDNRFEAPTVSPTDKEAVVEEIIDGLSHLSLPDGPPAFRSVVRASEAYKTAQPAGIAPDIFARPAPNTTGATTRSPEDGFVSARNLFTHRYRGIIVAYGPAFVSETTVEGMNLVDVLPTLLHAFDRPLAPNFDGIPRTDVVATDSEPTFADVSELPSPHVRQDVNLTADQEESLNDRLRHLGYVE